MQDPRILAQRPDAPVPDHESWRMAWLSPGQAIALLLLAVAGVAAFGITPDTTLDSIPTHAVTRTLAAPHVLALTGDPTRYWREERVQRGDTIGSLLARASIDDAQALTFLRTDSAARPLYQLRPGKPVHIATNDDGRLLALRFTTADGNVLSIVRDASGYTAQSAPPPADLRVTLRAGEIESSLFGAADDIGLPDAVTLALADIFAGDIDFYHDLRRGDRFVVLYETRYVDGEPIGTGRVLAAEFVNRGTTYRAFLWRAGDGSESYYGEDGRSNRKAFLRSPMELSRITSGFTAARFHPILQTWRSHRGVDFAAPIGTPVHVTADGTVAFVGQQTGYGNVVIVKHDGTYSTVYAHLSAFAARTRVGAHVNQGDTIARVGQTGWATGPHLHYEFRIGGQPRDPMTVALPHATPIDATHQAAFMAATAALARELAVARGVPDARIAAAE